MKGRQQITGKKKMRNKKRTKEEKGKKRFKRCVQNHFNVGKF